MKHSSRLEKNGTEPMYRQLADVLRREIENLPAGSLVAGDAALCRRFGVSQPVVRSALGLLVEEGLVRRLPSKGTYVEGPSHLRPRRRGKSIAVVSLLESFRPHIGAVSGVREVVTAQDFELVLAEPPSDPVSAESIYPTLLPLLERAEGVVWVFGMMQEHLKPDPRLREVAARVVFVNAAMMDDHLTCVLADYASAAYAVTRHLIDQGYRRIGLIGGPPDRLFAVLRREGFEKAMRAHGLPVEEPYSRLTAGNDLHQMGRLGIEALLRMPPIPEALFALTDDTAAGVIEGLRQAGLRVPEDVAVAGFDDSPLATRVTPNLTTARQPYPEVGRLAATRLLDQLGGKPSGGRHLVPCPLVVRDSSIRNKVRVSG
jgi:LacI family transcriptional regulator